MPRTLAQNAQYIAETIKPAIKSAIEAQGVTVPSTDSFLDYADRIGEIEGGGSGYQLKDLPTGAISTVSDAEPLPLNALKVSVEAVQDLHGYDHPWFGGAGKNKFDGDYPNINAGVQYRAINLGDGTFTMSTNCPETAQTAANLFFFAGNVSSGANTSSNGVSRYIPRTVTAIDGYVTVAYRNNEGVNPQDYNTQIEAGSTPTAFAPYSNICPIDGWDSGEITVCDDIQSPTQTETTTLNFPQTIYGAEWDVVGGELKQTDGYIASYNGESLPSTWISDRDVYASGTTPTTGAEVVYKLATPITIPISPLSIRMLQGTNNLYADCGEVIEGEYFSGSSGAYDLYDYIQSDGTQYINLGRQINANDVIKCTYMPLSGASFDYWNYVWGCFTSGNMTGVTLITDSLKALYTNGVESRVSYSHDTWYFEEMITASAAVNADLYVFSYSNTTAGASIIRLYAFSINGDDYLPCKRRSDGVFGLYDVANSQFLTDSASGNAFVGGNNLGVRIG